MYKILIHLVLRWLIMGMIGGLIYSCNAYKTLYIDILEPADTLLKGEGKIAFLNRKITASTSRHLSYYTEAFYTGIEAGLSDKIKFDSLVLLEEEFPQQVKRDYIIEPLLPETVNEICVTYDVDHIISLEYCYLGSPSSKGRWVVYLYSYDIPTFIDSMTYEYNLVVYDDTDYYAWQCGLLCARHIAPHWVRTERRLYFGSKGVKAGSILFLKGDLVQAEKQWLALLQTPSKQAMRAAINLAWLYESTEELEKAEAILLQARGLAQQKEISDYSIDYLELYLKTIKERIRSNKLLIRQLNSEF